MVICEMQTILKITFTRTAMETDGEQNTSASYGDRSVKLEQAFII